MTAKIVRSVRVSLELWEALQMRAMSRGVTPNALLEEAIARAAEETAVLADLRRWAERRAERLHRTLAREEEAALAEYRERLEAAS